MSLFTKTDRRYLSKARQAADISDYKNVHIGCVAVYKGNIIGIVVIPTKHIQYRNIITNIELLTLIRKHFFLKYMQKLAVSIQSDIWI